MFTDYKHLLGIKWDEGGKVSEDVLFELIKKIILKELSQDTIKRWQENNYSKTNIDDYANILTHIHNSSLGTIIRSLNDLLKPQQPVNSEGTVYLRNLLVLHAASIATIALEQQVKKSTWKDINKEINAAFNKLNSRPGLDGSICLIYDAISRRNHNAAIQWRKVYHISLEAINA